MATLSKCHGLSLVQLSNCFVLFSVTAFGPSPLQWVLRLLFGLATLKPASHLILEVITFTLFLFDRLTVFQ